MPIRWRVYYSDGSTFCDADGQPSDAPAWGVIVIAQWDSQVGRFLQHGTDYYWHDGDRWYGGDLPGVYDHLLRIGAVMETELGGFTHAWVEDGLVRQGDMLALIKFLARSGLVKFGRYILSEGYLVIYQQAASDVDLAPKSAFHWLERKPDGSA